MGDFADETEYVGSGIGFWVSGFGFWASGSGLRVSGFGFRFEFQGFGEQRQSGLGMKGVSGSTSRTVSRKVDVRLPGKGNSNSHGARPVY
jgi:hypothetical protein